MALLHATCVEINGKGILIMGPSGAGKSDLALRLIDQGGTLVSDDYVEVINQDGKLLAKTAPNIEGLIEVRGVGLMKIEHINLTILHLALDLVTSENIVRLPEDVFFSQDGVDIPLYKFDGFAVSATVKIRLMLSS